MEGGEHYAVDEKKDRQLLSEAEIADGHKETKQRV